MRGRTVKSPRLVAEAKRLRDLGLEWAEIGERLGVARSTAAAWVADPDGTKTRARKDSYAQPCMDCGAPTSGSEGRRAEPRCVACAAVLNGMEQKIWTREAVVLAIQEWAAKYGEPPAICDWGAWSARHKLQDEERARRAERDLAAGTCPTFQSAVRAFGSWNAALAAAGFDPRAPNGGGDNMQRRRSIRQRASGFPVAPEPDPGSGGQPARTGDVPTGSARPAGAPRVKPTERAS